jgi:putative acetyltransferase
MPALHSEPDSTPVSESTSAPEICIRRATQADAAAYARIMGDPAVFPSLMQLPWANESTWRARLDENTPAAQAELRIVAEVHGQVAGSGGLHPALQVRRRHCAMLGISVAADWQGRGVGRALMQAMCGYADDWGQILRIELTVFADNHRAIALYESCGFRREGIHRGYALRQGQYADVLTMARLHPRPPVVAWPEA